MDLYKLVAPLATAQLITTDLTSQNSDTSPIMFKVNNAWIDFITH